MTLLSAIDWASVKALAAIVFVSVVVPYTGRWAVARFFEKKVKSRLP